MKVLYTTGPKRVTMGAAGAFERGVAKDVDDKLAKKLTAKKSIVFYPEGTVPPEAKKALANLVAAEKAAADKPQKKEG